MFVSFPDTHSCCMPQLANISVTNNIYEGSGILRAMAAYTCKHNWQLEILANAQETYTSWLHIVLELSQNVQGYCRVVKLSSAEIWAVYKLKHWIYQLLYQNVHNHRTHSIGLTHHLHQYRMMVEYCQNCTGGSPYMLMWNSLRCWVLLGCYQYQTWCKNKII